MENPEEVLQALDEFQKLRPSEIPRELEDYLCFVAKTGDPVYQWSLIKALFREKLTRVMTDFYDSCPSLELTPCSNVEHFNYDAMKSMLLERLESFVNAPFTVQRICELLTSPRKEYNRIDKFMRAIEKNILVVSTREPGPTPRRSENGDGLVNGSVEDESPNGQPSHEVEMESWVKDWSTHAYEEHDGVTSENGLKRNHSEISNYMTTTEIRAEFPVASLTSQIQDTSVQNLSTINHEPTIVGDVTDAIMNEDTSSQPSLDLEGDENETPDPTRKTTFQAKDFISNVNKSPKPYVEEEEEVGKSDQFIKVMEGKGEQSEVSEIAQETPDDNVDALVENSEKTELSSGEEALVKEASIEKDSVEETIAEKTEKASIEEATTEKTIVEEAHIEEASVKEASAEEAPIEETPVEEAPIEEGPAQETSTQGVLTQETPVQETPAQEAPSEETPTEESIFEEAPLTVETAKEELCVNMTDTVMDEIPPTESEFSSEVEGIKAKPDTATENEEEETEPCERVDISTDPESTGESKPLIEEPPLDAPDSPKVCKNSDVTIEETVDEETKSTNTIVPDPIPIIEEPKEVDSTTKNWESSVSVVEITSDSVNTLDEKIQTAETLVESFEQPTMQEDSPKLPADDNKMLVSEEIMDITSSESMDVDNEGTIAPQDEPMEEESTDVMTS